MTQKIRLKKSEEGGLGDQAYAALKTALLAGRYAPGEKLVLRTVAEALDISLTPVRDAINRLIAEKILDRGGIGQGGGATVPLIDASQFNQLMIVRASLEPLATSVAAGIASAKALDDIEQHLQDMKNSVEKNRLDRYLDAHHRFHFSIYKAAQMPIILEMIESAWLRCGPTLTLALPEYIPSLKRYPFHLAALKALRKKNPEQAAAAIRADIESARTDIVAMLATDAAIR